MAETSSPTSISTRLERIAELARQSPTMALTTLAHHIDVAWLHEAYRRTRRDGAPGIDGETWTTYGEDLEANLKSLVDRFKSGTYHAPPVRRVFIPKSNGKLRPIGIPTLEDKVLQRAVAAVLTAVYEQDFLPCSFAFRPRRSAHQALQTLWDRTMEMGGGWVIELDIEDFFGSLDHKHLRAFLDQRVRDGVIRRMIDKWLAAGVLNEGRLERSAEGTPQGGVVSPLLANLYLHEVLDVWFERKVKPVLASQAHLIRYADDAVLVFRNERDARRVLAVLPKRFAKYGLRLHPEKTRLVPFRQPSPHSGGGSKDGGRFEFLGFTHHWGRSRKGKWIVKRKTAAKRLTQCIRSIWQWCRAHRHMKVREQHAKLVLKVRGHYAYFGITGNIRALAAFLHYARRAWRYWLARRGQRGGMPWERLERLTTRYPLPTPIVVHSVYRSNVAKP